MAHHLDLEEQEQLAQLKHFWARYGNAITWVVIAVCGAIAAWNGWQYWQQRQAQGAAAMYDELDRAVAGREAPRMEQVLADLRANYAGTAYAQQGALLGAKGLADAGQAAPAKAALEWAATKGTDQGLQAVARLRLSALALEAKDLDQAAQWLQSPVSSEFVGLFSDRQGDVHMAKGQRSEAIAAYQKAYAQMDTRTEYRRLVEVKLNALGVDPLATATTVR